MIELAAGAGDARRLAVGVGAAGMVDSSEGVLRFAPNLAWRDLPIAARMRDALGLPCQVDNDANAAAFAEYRFGAGRGSGTCSSSRWGPGSAAASSRTDACSAERTGSPPTSATSSSSRMARSAGAGTAAAGSRSPRAGPSIGCGREEATEQEHRSILRRLAGGDPSKVTGKLVTEAAEQGDAAAAPDPRRGGRRLGQGIAGLVNVIDPQIVVVGGGAIVAGDLLLEPARVAFLDARGGPRVPAARAGGPGAARQRRRRGGGGGPRARGARARDGVKVGLVLPLFSGDPEQVLTFARRAEDLGYDGLFAFDHLFPPGAPSDRASLEAYTMLAAVASVTERVAIGTLVTRAALRPAGMVAKLGASLDRHRSRTARSSGSGPATRSTRPST